MKTKQAKHSETPKKYKSFWATKPVPKRLLKHHSQHSRVKGKPKTLELSPKKSGMVAPESFPADTSRSLEKELEDKIARIEKHIRYIKTQHCDGCEPNEMCNTCKENFRELRIPLNKLKAKLEGIKIGKANALNMIKRMIKRRYNELELLEYISKEELK